MADLASWASRHRSGVARALSRVGARPDHLTVLGLFLGVASGYLFYGGHMRWAALVLLAGGACDFFDGEVARVSGRSSQAGAFLDSTLDRISEAAVFGGILLYYAGLGADKYVALTFVALVGSFMTSYTRARAEGLSQECRVGLYERPERLVTLVVAGLSGRMSAGVWILVFATAITVIQRIVHVRLVLRPGAEAPAADGKDLG